MRTLLSFLIIWVICLLPNVLFGFSINDVFRGIEKTTYEEMHLPNLQWINELGFHLQGGYDIHSGSVLVDGTIEAQMFENFHLQLGGVFESANENSSHQFQITVGAKAYLSRPNSLSYQNFREANRIILERKLQAVELYFQYIQESINQLAIDPSHSTIDRIEFQRSRVDQAYALSQLKTLSGIEYGELETPSIEQISLTPIREEDLILSIINYLQVQQPIDPGEKNDWYVSIRSDIRNDKLLLMGGIGYDLSFSSSRVISLNHQMDEVGIRRMKLQYDVLYENLPLLQKEIQQVKALRNQMTQDLIRQRVTQAEVDHFIQLERNLTIQYDQYLLEAKKIEMKLRVMRGE